MIPHLVVALSYHGFGHIGQTAPVIQRLRQILPQLRITLRTSAPKYKLLERFGPEIAIEEVQTDIGMIQKDALHIDLPATASAYVEFHRDWGQKVEQEARALQRLNADLVLANVPYLALAGAARAQIPALALCSLNWADIYEYFFNKEPQASEIITQMRAGYNSAKHFLLPAPSMPMPGLSNTVPIGPIAQAGQNRRNEILTQLNLPMDHKIVMISVGGMEIDIAVKNWPRFPATVFLTPDTWSCQRRDMVNIGKFNFPFIDLMYSCDALITKPGYGSFVEAACTNTPVLYLERQNWPEAPFLIQWLEQHGRCLRLETKHFKNGEFAEPLNRLLETGSPAKLEPTGIQNTIDYLLTMLT